VNKVDWLGEVPEPIAAFDMRRFWRKIADELREKGYALSALFLERALESQNAKTKDGKLIPWRFKGEVSGKIKKSTEYKDVIAKVISALSVGRHEVQKEPTNFPNSLLAYKKDGDLKCSVKQAMVSFVRGTVCKTGFGADHKPGSDTVFLVVDVNGSYSYEKDRFVVLDDETISACEKYKAAVNDFDWVTTIEER
jgi:hypothetical protein